MSAPVLTETDDDARWITLHRPAVRNAIDVPTQEALHAALVDAAADGDVRAIVLTGTDPAFSAGGDLSRFDETDHTAFRLASHDLTRVVDVIERIEKPIVAALNGVATGVGAQLALACDVRIASDRARLLWREGHLGLLPAHGGIARLVQLIGLAPARDLVLGGYDLDADRAHAIGLVSEVVAHDELHDCVRDRLRLIAGRSADAYAVAKRVLGTVAGLPLSTGLSVETLGQSLLVGTDEFATRLERARNRSAGRAD
jgi:enoyl-CoA hydratase/carnithine racemase